MSSYVNPRSLTFWGGVGLVLYGVVQLFGDDPEAGVRAILEGLSVMGLRRAIGGSGHLPGGGAGVAALISLVLAGALVTVSGCRGDVRKGAGAAVPMLASHVGRSICRNLDVENRHAVEVALASLGDMSMSRLYADASSPSGDLAKATALYGKMWEWTHSSLRSLGTADPEMWTLLAAQIVHGMVIGCQASLA